MRKPEMLDDSNLERSEVVANNAMNRERGMVGPNSYAKDLGVSPVEFLFERLNRHERVTWLDLCCGTGRALIQAAQTFRPYAAAGRIEIIGIDLVPMFDPVPPGSTGLRLLEASVTAYEPTGAFDLITCVHGLHYVGDKLGFLCRAAGWLREDGLLLAHLDLQNLQIADHNPSRTKHSWNEALRRAGFIYLRSRHLVRREGNGAPAFPYRYLGADDQAGPNFSGQPAVNSWYEHDESKP